MFRTLDEVPPELKHKRLLLVTSPDTLWRDTLFLANAGEWDTTKLGKQATSVELLNELPSQGNQPNEVIS
jgi:hypothetical protein